MWGTLWGEVNHNNVQDGWPGIGNIDSDPMFVDPEHLDFRLHWGSPCIDAGSPDPQYDDPDDTRADIGAFYYDQSVPVRVLLTPHERSIVIPPEGGSFDYTLWLTCIDSEAPRFEVWCDVIMPDGTIYGPLLGPVEAELDSGITVDYERIQLVPPNAPEGVYSYNAYAVVESDTSYDSFNFFKLEADGSDWASGWANMGESFKSDEFGGGSTPSLRLPSDFGLDQNYPNPFNPRTTFRFGLPKSEHIILTVHNLLGQEVARLVDGYREAGYHELIFDASNLTSGLYIYNLRSQNYSKARKMLFVK
jgi:hypothetical protein